MYSLSLDMGFSSEASVWEGLPNSWKNKCNWHFSQIFVECTPAVFIIHIFLVCYVLAFFHDESCCRVLELSCYLSCLNQECVGGYLRTKYCRTFCHIFELNSCSGERCLSGLVKGRFSTEAKHDLLMLPVHSCLAAAFAMSMRIENQTSTYRCLITCFKSLYTGFVFWQVRQRAGLGHT